MWSFFITQAMLQRYGSSVDDSILTKLVLAFSELRHMADEGLIAYPYSTREVVNIVKHLEVCKKKLNNSLASSISN